MNKTKIDCTDSTWNPAQTLQSAPWEGGVELMQGSLFRGGW